MIADLKPYPEYKESGLPWLGAVPEHWETRRLKQIARLAYGDSLPRTGREEGTVPVYGSNGRVGWHSDSNTRAPCIVVGRKGSFGKINFCNNAAFVIDTAFFIDRRMSRADIRWLYHTLTWIKLDGVSKDSAIPGLDREDAYQQVAAIPPPDEQAAIVRFLDWTNGRLERAIKAKRRVIALLNEQKQAIIHGVVTRGLDPTVPLKPSGIPWLGDIPRHWDVQRTKNVFRLRTQKSGLAHGKELLSIYTHIGVRPRKDLEQKGNKASTTDDYWMVHKGDLIVNKLLAWMGAVGSSDYEGVTSPAYDILMPTRPLCSHYYHHLFRTKLYLSVFKQRSRGIMDMRLRLYFDQLGQIPVPFPPVDEQAAIVEFYLEATADLTATISRLEREIELLREYRTRLVADVVTGKLDVREAAAQLPDEGMPDTTEDDIDLIDEAETTNEEVAV